MFGNASRSVQYLQGSVYLNIHVPILKYLYEEDGFLGAYILKGKMKLYTCVLMFVGSELVAGIIFSDARTKYPASIVQFLCLMV